MLDARTLELIPEHWLHDAEYWRATPFVWERWTRPHDEWTQITVGFAVRVSAMHVIGTLTINQASWRAGTIVTPSMPSKRTAPTYGFVDPALSAFTKSLGGRE